MIPRTARWVLMATVVLTAASEARAQYGYPMGYGRYGWGGWGSTVNNNVARGIGAFYMGRGLGAYNLDTSEARSINTNTVMRWNNYVFQANQAEARRYSAKLKAEDVETNKMMGQIQDRVRNHPIEEDILDGDALNALLDEVLNPANVNRSLHSIRTPLRHDVIPDIPFEYASEGMTVCLDRMTSDQDWPMALRVDALQPEREAVRKAVVAALKEDQAGNLQPKTIEAVRGAVDRLMAKYEKVVPQGNPDYFVGYNTIKAMAGLTRMLYSPKMDKILAELEDYQGTTLGDLLAFMQTFNLRFAPANSFRQKQIYRKLYPMLAEWVNGPTGPPPGPIPAAEVAGDGAVRKVEEAGTDAITGLKSAAIDLFKDMKSW